MDALPLSARDASQELPHDSLHKAFVGTSVACMILVSIFIGARFTAKRSVSSHHIEDYLLMITWPLLLGFTIALVISANRGAGDHIWNISPEEFSGMQQANYVIDIFYALATWSCKTALLLQLQRIFSPTRSGVVYVSCYILTASVAITYSVTTFVLILQCIPVRKVWDPTVTGGHCLDEAAASTATGVINVVTDFLILALPIWAIFHLNMPLRRKFTVSAIFATGLLACVCSLCRMVYSFQVSRTSDFTYIIAKLGTSSICELTSIVLCACFPLMPRFIQICKSTDRGSQIFSLIFPRSSQTPSSDPGEKTLSSGDDSCIFCDETVCCAVHGASRDIEDGNVEKDHHESEDTTSIDSRTTDHEGSQATQVEDAPTPVQKDGSIVVQREFKVAHGVCLNQGARDQSLGL